MSRMNFVNLRYYKNETKAKQPTSTLVKKSVYYYGYGTDITLPDGTTVYPEEQRGDWYSSRGEETYGDVVTWASGNALNHKYTYTMVLSLRDGQMEPEDFVRAMEQAAGNYFEDYRLIVHYDTEHDHAHVMAFRDKILRRDDFNAFRLTMRNSLAELEQERIQEREAAWDRSSGISIDNEIGWEDDLGL